MKTNTDPFLNPALKLPQRAHSRFVTLLVALFAGITLAMPQIEAAQPHPKNLTVLPEIEGALDIVPFDLNNRGQVIGVYFDADFILHGFLYANGAYTILDMYPNKINNQGQIVGSAFNSDFNTLNFVYDKGVYTSIEFPGALVNSTFVTGLNDRGQIIGLFSDGQKDHGFIYDKGVYSVLPDAPGAKYTYPQSINNQGEILVWSYDSDFNFQSFIYSKDGYSPFAAPGVVTTFPSDINNAGQIVGSYTDTDFFGYNFVSQKGVFTNIEIPGAVSVSVYGINDRGQVVGTYYDEEFRPYGFVLSR